MADFMDASKKIAALGGGKTGYCLRGGPGGANGYMMLMPTTYGSNDYFDKDGNSYLNEPEAVARAAVAGRHVQERLRLPRTASTGASTRSWPASIRAPAPCSTRTRTR